MFENILNELNNLQSFKYKIDIPVDEEGYFDKECPNEECLYQFKIFADDWKNICKDEAIYCPRCGKTATSDKWFTTQQIEESKQRAIQTVKNKIGSALEKDARAFNRRQKNGFIKLNMKVSGFKNFECNLPLSCKELIEQKIECKQCHTRYAVIGSAFYCPSCGNNSAINTFDEFIKTTYSKLNNLDKINNAIESKDDANRIIRALLESIPNDLVESIQCLSEAVYDLLPNKKNLKKNVFQRIDDSNNLWKEAADISFENWLTEEEFEKMKIYYQRRHLLIHTNGIVDEDYLNKTNDSNYRVGERIVFDIKSALEFTNIIEKVGEGIKKNKWRVITMIYITGDTHADFSRFNEDKFPIQNEMTKNDYVIICGDFGGVWNYIVESMYEKYWLDWLNTRNFTTLFVDGNHENYTRLYNEYPIEEWHGGKVHKIRDSVLHLMRGEIFDIDGKKIFAFGGAKSHDIQDGILNLDEEEKIYEYRKRGAYFRIRDYSWWDLELPTEEEMQNGINNLEKANYKVDYIISHCCPTSIQTLLGAGRFEKDYLTDYFQKIMKKCEFKKWYFGHYHDYRQVSSQFVLLYEDIVPLEFESIFK